MAKKTGMIKDKTLQQKPEENPLEKEIEDLIDREKTRRTIVSKLLNQTNAKNRKSDN